MLVNINHIDAFIIRSVAQYKNYYSTVAIKSKSINKHLAYNDISESWNDKEILNLYFSEPC